MAPNLIERTQETLGMIAGVFFSTDYLGFMFLAAIPALVWLYLFLRHQRERPGVVILTFLAGMLAVVPVFIFRYEIAHVESWWLLAGSALVVAILSAAWVGVYEETAKMWIVKKVDGGRIRSVDDAIQFAIIGALGFAFLENILYFYQISQVYGTGAEFFKIAALRGLLSVGLHVVASGIFGYFYGVAHFAQPILREQIHHGKRYPVIGVLQRILHLRPSTLFHEEKIMEGLLIAAGIHGLFDFFMSIGSLAPRLSGYVPLFGLMIVIPGYFYLTYLLDKKEDHQIYDEISDKRTSG